MSRVIANWVLFWLDCGHLVRNSLSTSWRSCENIRILLQNESSFSNACILTCMDSKKKNRKEKKRKMRRLVSEQPFIPTIFQLSCFFRDHPPHSNYALLFSLLKTFKSPLQRFIWQNNARCFAFPARNEWTEAWKSKVSAWKNLKHFNFWKLERNKWKVWNYHDFVFHSKRVDLNSPNNERINT